MIMSEEMTNREMHDSKGPSSPTDDGLGLNNLNRKRYDKIYYLTQLIVFLILILLFIWLNNYLNGLSFETPSQIFNFHPFLMFLGFIFLFSNAILIYRSLRHELKQKLKLYHTILNGIVIIISFFGSLSAIYYHHKLNIAHFYSLHSWLGILVWLLFLIQFCGGFVTYLFPGASNSFRQFLMPYHRFSGIAIFCLAIATCLTGLNEKAIFAFKNPPYSAMQMNGIITNLIGILLFVYAGLIVYLATKSDYQRRPLSEEMAMRPRTQGL